MLKKLLEENLIEGRGIVGFYPTNAVDTDDIEI